MADPKSPSAFISYSHDSDDHAGRVLELADALRGRGINVILDQYVHPAPEEGWPRWMDRNLDEAQFVLMVCTETYRRRVMGREEPGKGLGVRWEGSLIDNRIYHDTPSGSRFIPILLRPGSEPAHIPNPVQGHAYYRITTFDLTDPGFEALYRHLTGQAPTPPPDLGTITTLPPRPRRGSSRHPIAAQPDTVSWDPRILQNAQRKLARIVGPMAEIFVRDAAQQARDLEQLYEILATAIPLEEDRLQFLRSRPG